MAAEVPVTDVLCEAMEYLAKLGSNLRRRSESLKVKRISKEKLLNAHAIQKAANKVLLICELSKKSLENVESGIRNVLSNVDASQSLRNGGKCLNSREEQKNNSDFRYFTYQSRKLKIAKSKRVPLKHFTSAKVFAKKMPVSVHDKYPVYYDCKLYRLRKRKHALTEDESDEINANISQKNSLVRLQDENKAKEIISLTDKLNCIQVSNSDTECKIGNKHTASKDVSKSSTELTVSNEEDNNSSRRNSQGHRSISLDDSQNKNAEDEESTNNVSFEEVKKSDELDLKNKNYSKKKSKRHNMSEESDNNSLFKNNTSKEHGEKKYKKTKFKKLIVFDDSSNSSKEFKQEEMSEKCVETDNDNNMSISKISNSVGSDSETKSTNNEPSIPDNIAAEVENNDSEIKKPSIKCVSITKLLKPDVLKSKSILVSCLTNKPQNARMKTKAINPTTQENSTTHNDLIIESNKTEEQEYSAKRKKEVTDFIPKSFVINITRLPKLSERFLQEHNLKLISRNGNVLCQVSNEPKDKSEYNSNDCNHTKSKKNEDANKVKNALLNDSDSDDNISSSNLNKELIAEAEKVKNALLNDSDSDQNETSNSICKKKHGPEEILIDSETKKDTLLYETDSDKGSEVPNIDPKIDTKSKENEIDKLVNISQLDVELQQSNKALNEETVKQHHIPNDSTGENQLKESENFNDIKKSNNSDIKPVNSDEEVSPTRLQSDKSSQSSEDNPKTLSQRKKRKHSLTPQSKRKHIMESMKAKKMLLTYSSSSDTDDEQLRKALNEIKKSLLTGVSSDEEISLDKKNLQRRSVQSSPSSSDILTKINDTETRNSTANSSDSENQNKKKRRSSHMDLKNEKLEGIDHIDGNTDEQSNSSSSKVGKL